MRRRRVEVTNKWIRMGIQKQPSDRLLPLPPQTQARSSATFRPPPLDGSLALPQLYAWHLDHTPNHRLFIYADQDGSVKTIYWPEAVRAMYTGARIIKDRLQQQTDASKAIVVAILAGSDTIPYFITLMSIMCANLIAFPISPRNSASAVAHLISKVGIDHILVGREQSMRDLSLAAFDKLKTQYPSTPTPELSPMFVYLRRKLCFNFPIFFQSGSTAYPKPIPFTNHRLVQMSLIPWYGERDLTDQILSLHTMPMYHGMGMTQLCWTMSCGLVASAFAPQSPTLVPTPESLFKAAKATKSDIIFCVPTFIEAWSHNPDYVKWLATRGGVLFGGGPLNQEVGDNLAAKGVSIFNLYGSTEAGIISIILPSKAGYDWEYFKFPALITPEMVPNGNNTFELVIVANNLCRPSVINTIIGGIDAYSTSDLLSPHPTKTGYWKVYGRTDDQIMHSTGEKTNPGPLENTLNQSPFIQSSVIFGRGRFQAGVIVDPKLAYHIDPSDEGALAELRNKIWPMVERLNEYAPQHSRLFKEMIIVSKPSKPFTYTAKNTARRQAILDDYEEEINAVYDAVEESTQATIAPPAQWDLASTTEFIRGVMSSVLSRNVSDYDDVFQHGCDSLQATWIRNTILRAIRDSTRFDTRQIVGNFIYDYPTVATLSKFIHNLLFGCGGDIQKIGAVETMRLIASRYSQNFPSRKTNRTVTSSGRSTVLLTGSTGALGCYLLVGLLSHPNVSRVYALNRGHHDGKTLVQRQEEALLNFGLDVGALDSDNVVLCEGDPASEFFNLSSALYEEMQRSVTHIIHNAWRVDFNPTLTTFEINIKGLRNLIDFSLLSPLQKPARLLYASSIGVFRNVESNALLMEQPIEPEIAVGTGYSESKWVSENILCEAAEHTEMEVLIVRVGQLSGGLNGAWNITEWLPALVQSASILGLLPDDHKQVSWIPLDIAASAFIDFCTASKFPSKRIVHLIHPRPVRWSSLAAVLSSEFSVPLVPYTEWLSRLEQEAVDAEDNSSDLKVTGYIRALRLQSFFKHIATKTASSEAFGFDSFDTREAIALSSQLANPALRQLGREDVKNWLGYWRNKGLLEKRE
ncbi:hypothetical protein SERLA73DRAFT_172085 [Serpula lacrymans var. lacrymans S7.3]|uniref:Polyketide synthase phosphopantetheine-binding domain-containing protein n=1 Tax=Serpula lacrymans var. lacrymans (strain S7.3) TaxID=936435 RepID=F8QE64_SERL3|nr:hypothetical protein SERLA73DRAFT_172085 [Serpula lacrymans var. lacrymans S7.3]